MLNIKIIGVSEEIIHLLEEFEETEKVVDNDNPDIVSEIGS
jgi:hypothetical protein